MGVATATSTSPTTATRARGSVGRRTTQASLTVGPVCIGPARRRRPGGLPASCGLDCSVVPESPPPPLQMAEVQRAVGAELDRISPVIDELGGLFEAAGHELALVGGPVRDAMLGRRHNDLDFATSARPEETERILKRWGDAYWDMGRDFGTIGCRKGDWVVEVTTYRSEAYDPTSRKPVVDFGDSLAGDLGRRDFTVNAMAVRVPSREFEDPYGGVVDLAHRVIRTPGRPEDSFSDDPAADDAGRAVRRPAGLRGRRRW